MAAVVTEEFQFWLEWARVAPDRDLLRSLAATAELAISPERVGLGRLAALLQATRERTFLSSHGLEPGQVPVGLRPFNTEAFRYYVQLERLRSWVEKHLDEPISLKQAAQVATFETTYFSKFFHQKVGVCFTDWLLWMRIQRALALLASRDLSITAAARRSGFYDVRTFQRAFKKFTGTTPSRYRERVRRKQLPVPAVPLPPKS